jgi:putative transposase
MGEKKIKGRKRHIVMDVMGNLLSVNIHAANIHDTVGGCETIDRAFEKYSTITGVCGDEGYRKTFEEYVAKQNKKVDISKKIKSEWHVIPKRWCVERTFSWLNNDRRLSKDYEIVTSTAQSLVYISHSATLLRRIT